MKRKTSIINGSTGGIGFEITQARAAQGIDQFIAYGCAKAFDELGAYLALTYLNSGANIRA